MIVVQVLFWILLILSAIGCFAEPPGAGPGFVRARFFVVLIELGILGYMVFNGVK